MSGFHSRFGITQDLRRVSENPFTDLFTMEEVAFYDVPETYDEAGIKVSIVEPRGQVDDYLNRSFRIQTGLRVPVLRIDGQVWMSLTPMEVQSAYVAIAMAQGVVGTAGLGLGYFALRAASSPDVEAVHVYELNPRVIGFFQSSFKGRPELDKIVIHEGDVRKLVRQDKKGDPAFDMFFMDVYQTLLPDEVVADIHLFERKVNLDMGMYRFWGEERVILDALMGGLRPRIPFLDRAFLATWQQTLIDPNDPELEGMKLSDLYQPLSEEDYQVEVLEPLEFL